MKGNDFFMSKFKKIVLLLSMICFGAGAETLNIDWLVDGETYSQTTCNYGDDLILPNTPQKYGYTFVGWIPNFTQIEYLQSTGTQAINTLWTPQSEKIEIIIKLSYGSQNRSFFGRGASNACSGYIYGQTTLFNSSLFLGESVNGIASGFTGATETVLKIVLDNNSFTTYQDSVQKNNGIYTGSLRANPWPLYIFSSYYCNTIQQPASYKLYYFQIYDNDTLVRDFIPVLDDNGVACMYDKVSGQFFYNAGTGDFIAGPTISE